MSTGNFPPLGWEVVNQQDFREMSAYSEVRRGDWLRSRYPECALIELCLRHKVDPAKTWDWVFTRWKPNRGAGIRRRLRRLKGAIHQRSHGHFGEWTHKM